MTEPTTAATSTSRRDLLRKGAIGAGLAWTAPLVLSVEAAGAVTPSPLAPEFFALVSGVFSTSGSLDSPATTLLGDKLLLVVAFGAGADLTTTPTGMNLVGAAEAAPGEHEVHVYEKDGAAGGETIAFGCDAGVTVAAALVVYRPGLGGTGVAVDDATLAVDAGTTHAYPALASGATNRRIVRLGGAGWALSTGDWLSAPNTSVRLLTSVGGPYAATVQVSDGVDEIATADGTTSTAGLAVTHSVALVTT